MDNYEIVRYFSSFFVGVLISLNGSFAQTLTQNPLAAPSTLGVQAVALFIYLLGFTLTKFMGGEYLENTMVLFHLFFFLFALVGTKVKAKESFVKKIIVVGLCLNLFVASIYSLVQFILLNKGVQFPSELWFGNFRYSSENKLWFILGIFLAVFTFSFFVSKRLRLFVLGEEFSKSYLRSLPRLEKGILNAMIYSTCVITFFYGYFSFLGLVFPHLLRSFSFFKRDVHNEVVWGSLIGGLLFSLIDAMCYHFPVSGSELPIGMITSVLGPMVLLIVLFSRRNTIKNIY